VHFGLGSDAVATKVEITWPSGIVQTLENVSGDRIVPVTEPVPAKAASPAAPAAGAPSAAH
jgi:hypothetical protein